MHRKSQEHKHFPIFVSNTSLTPLHRNTNKNRLNFRSHKLYRTTNPFEKVPASLTTFSFFSSQWLTIAIHNYTRVLYNAYNLQMKTCKSVLTWAWCTAWSVHNPEPGTLRVAEDMSQPTWQPTNILLNKLVSLSCQVCGVPRCAVEN